MLVKGEIVKAPLGKPGQLATIGNLKTEMSRVYRRGALGECTMDEMKSAIWSLRQIAAVASQVELEERLNRLEQIYDQD